MTQEQIPEMIPIKFIYQIPENEIDPINKTNLISKFNIHFESLRSEIIESKSFIEVIFSSQSGVSFKFSSSDIELRKKFESLKNTLD